MSVSMNRGFANVLLLSQGINLVSAVYLGKKKALLATMIFIPFKKPNSFYNRCQSVFKYYKRLTNGL
jgi:hypothetical protein